MSISEKENYNYAHANEDALLGKIWKMGMDLYKTASDRWDMTHPTAFLWVAPASSATVQASTRLVRLATLQK